MKVNAINTIYTVEIKKIFFQGKYVISITAGNLLTGTISVAISQEDWKKIKEKI